MFGWFGRAPAAPTEDQLRVSQALASYPPYAPPEWKADSNPESMRAASSQYRDFFIGGIPARLEALRAFLANFDVALNLDNAGLMAISAWLPRYGDLLVNDFDDEVVRDAYRHFDVPWTGPLIGLNVIFDLGIYNAECLWTRRTKLKWQVGRGLDVHGHLIAHHFIIGIPGGKWFDPFHYTYVHCRNIRTAKINKHRRQLPYSDTPWILESDSFSRHVRAKAPPGRRRRKTAR
jgi:hypothetical protein